MQMAWALLSCSIVYASGVLSGITITAGHLGVVDDIGLPG